VHDDLEEHLQKFGYDKTAHTEGLFKHKAQNITFTLVVYGFGIKYTEQEDANHLVKAVWQKYHLR